MEPLPPLTELGPLLCKLEMLLLMASLLALLLAAAYMPLDPIEPGPLPEP